MALADVLTHRLAWIPAHDTAVGGIIGASHVIGYFQNREDLGIDAAGTRSLDLILRQFGATEARAVPVLEVLAWRRDSRTGVFGAEWFWQEAGERARRRITTCREYFNGSRLECAPDAAARWSRADAAQRHRR